MSNVRWLLPHQIHLRGEEALREAERMDRIAANPAFRFHEGMKLGAQYAAQALRNRADLA